MPYGIARNDIEPGAIIPSKLGTELERYSKTFFLAEIAADSDALVIPLWKPPYAITIKRILMGVDTTVTAQDTDYNKIDITDGTNIIATVSTGPAATGTTLTAGAFTTLTLDADYVAIANTETIKVDFTKTGNGLAMSGLNIQIDYEIDDPS